ncbi:MAG TPA: tetratricopeptide repeat protein [Alphaproteobacteria bacterium]|nr:tetratricopeptide repeat protein [Alphaproteobacteria bacterium]
MAKAAQFLEQGASQGDPTALHMLGFMYEAGEHFERDVRKAFELYAAASRAGHLGASTNLGKLYQLGIGTERDLKKAVRL